MTEESVLRGRSIGSSAERKKGISERVFLSNAAVNRILTRCGIRQYSPREQLAAIEAQYELTDEQRLIVMAMIRGTGALKRRDDISITES